MRAAEHQRVGAALQERLHEGAHGLARRGPGGLPLLDQIHPARTRLAHHRRAAGVGRQQPHDVRALERDGGGQHADDARLRARDGRLDGRLDGHDRQVEPRAQPLDRHAGHGVAGHHDRLDALRDQEIHDGKRTVLDVGRRPIAVRRVARVGHIDQVLVGQLARISRSTDRPPTPESKTPIGSAALTRGWRPACPRPPGARWPACPRRPMSRLSSLTYRRMCASHTSSDISCECART